MARWSAAPWPLVFASALKGEGVLASFEALLRSTYRHFAESCELVSRHGLDEEAFVAGALGKP